MSKILEVSEQERHCEVLLTLKNLADVKRSPTPYSVSIIPRSLPSEIVGGEHFVTTDLLDFLAGCTLSTRNPEAEALSREQASRASSVPSTSTSGGSSYALPVPGPEEGSVCPVGLSLQRTRIDPAPPSIDDKEEEDHQREECSRGPGGRFYTLGSF